MTEQELYGLLENVEINRKEFCNYLTQQAKFFLEERMAKKKYEIEIKSHGCWFKGRFELDKMLADVMMSEQHKKTYKIKIREDN